VALDEHLFRRESGRMLAALTRVFGVHNLSLAEDVVQDAFVRALEVWKFRGAPENPGAWLMTTARRRAIDVLRRDRTARTFAPELGRLLDSEWTLVPAVDEIFDAQTVPDDQLRMMFTCCHPRLAEEVQIALVLNVLCGFGASEIAAAFLTSDATIQKRLQRGKKALAASKRLFELSAADFSERRAVVLRALYLLFNEGYHSASALAVVRQDLCEEALRLSRLLLAHRLTDTPDTRALAGLMCFNVARLPGRLHADGRFSPLVEQDRSRWSGTLIAEGRELLERAAEDGAITEYHIEAAMAAIHTGARSVEETDWRQLVALYDALLRMRPSPVVALNRAIAVAQHQGPQAGLDALAAIADRGRLDDYPFYFAARGDFCLRLEHRDDARAAFTEAARLARNETERRFFADRVAACTPRSGPDA
jgi:RNA polymerase sigma factor (sigma-70 family)